MKRVATVLVAAGALIALSGCVDPYYGYYGGSVYGSYYGNGYYYGQPYSNNYYRSRPYYRDRYYRRY